jgi:hypothetical protein
VLRGRRPGVITISGAEYFGLLSPDICYVIQHMDGAEQCQNYVMRRFEPPMPLIHCLQRNARASGSGEGQKTAKMRCPDIQGDLMKFY